MDKRNTSVLLTSAKGDGHMRATLVGSWLLEEAITINDDDGTICQWGGFEAPIKGILIYHENGWMSVQMSGGRPMATSQAEYDNLSDTAKLKVYSSYYAYYGEYEVDELAKMVIHKLQDSILPFEKGMVFQRAIEIKDGVLRMESFPQKVSGKILFHVLTWKKTT